jgi:hypothetical protein
VEVRTDGMENEGGPAASEISRRSIPDFPWGQQAPAGKWRRLLKSAGQAIEGKTEMLDREEEIRGREEGEMTDMENRIYLFKLWPRVCPWIIILHNTCTYRFPS